jgi:protoheme IX farnesyltransferase
MAINDADGLTPTLADTAVTGGVVRGYYELTKPGISQMVALTTLAGYYLALPTDLGTAMASTTQWLTFAATMIGTIAISSGSCALNHVMEKDEDARMRRTARRPIPTGLITPLQATTFGVALSIIGVALLSTVNMLTLGLAIATWLIYLAVYTPMKKYSSLAVIVGGIPGALPFAGGWTAVRGTMDAEAWVLFAILFFWQLPHFYALSWMYRDDYRAGGVVLKSHDDEAARPLGTQMIITSVLTLFSAVLPTVLGMTGMLYVTGAAGVCLWLVWESLRFRQHGSHAAARRVLLTSYAALMAVVILMFVDKL